MRVKMRENFGTLIHIFRNTVLKAFAARGMIGLARDGVKPALTGATFLHGERYASCRYETCTLDCMKGVEIASDGNHNSFECKRRDGP